MESILEGVQFYFRHADLGANFWRYRLICRAVDRAVQGNLTMWQGQPFGSKVPKAPPLAIVARRVVGANSFVVLELPCRLLVGDLYILALRRVRSADYAQSVRDYQIELHRRWRHVRAGFADERSAECQELHFFIHQLRRKQLEYGIFIDG